MVGGKPSDILTFNNAISIRSLISSVNTGKRKSKKISGIKGRYLKAVHFNDKFKKIAIFPTIIKSLTEGDKKSKIDIKKENLMAKAFSEKKQTNILFLVDASGSMGVEELMDKTKGLVFDLLKDAYINRERVGFITFRGTKAEVILSFTKSISMAKEELKKIKTGGKTPLSLALKKALEVLEMEMLKDKNNEFVLLIFTDGRANISISGIDPFEEALIFGKLISEKGIKTFIIDTDPTWINYPYAKDVARVMDAKYFKLSDILKGNIREIIYS